MEETERRGIAAQLSELIEKSLRWGGLQQRSEQRIFLRTRDVYGISGPIGGGELALVVINRLRGRADSRLAGNRSLRWQPVLAWLGGRSQRLGRAGLRSSA